MYHLYTVDIVCTGLPLTDLNTLEFADAEKDWEAKQKHVFGMWVELGSCQHDKCSRIHIAKLIFHDDM